MSQRAGGETGPENCKMQGENDMDKLITFAVPCYNSAAYMEHCVDTLLQGGDEIGRASCRERVLLPV